MSPPSFPHLLDSQDKLDPNGLHWIAKIQFCWDEALLNTRVVRVPTSRIRLESDSWLSKFRSRRFQSSGGSWRGSTNWPTKINEARTRRREAAEEAEALEEQSPTDFSVNVPDRHAVEAIAEVRGGTPERPAS